MARVAPEPEREPDRAKPPSPSERRSWPSLNGLPPRAAGKSYARTASMFGKRWGGLPLRALTRSEALRLREDLTR